MCLVKKFSLDLKRSFISGHCVAVLSKPDTKVIDMCLFSGEGKPTLLGGYAITREDALKLGNDLIINANRIKASTPAEKKQIAGMHLITAYNLLKESAPEEAEKLKDTMGIKEIKKKEPDLGYVG